jgi:uncharacterized membrane protein
LALAIWLSWQAAPGRAAMAEAERQVAAHVSAPAMKEIEEIVISRCSMCHAQSPVWEGIHAAPKAVTLENIGEIARQMEAIALHSVATHAMPPNNITEMSAEERGKLALWYAHRQAGR